MSDISVWISTVCHMHVFSFTEELAESICFLYDLGQNVLVSGIRFAPKAGLTCEFVYLIIVAKRFYRCD